MNKNRRSLTEVYIIRPNSIYSKEFSTRVFVNLRLTGVILNVTGSGKMVQTRKNVHADGDTVQIRMQLISRKVL